MKPLSIVICLLIVLMSFGTVHGTIGETEGPAFTIKTEFNDDPELEFLENLGQKDEDIHFYTRGMQRIAFLQDSLVFIDQDMDRTISFKMSFSGSCGSVPAGTDMTPTTYNYLIGNDRSDWGTGVRSYGSLRYEDIYNGIDLVVASKGGDLKYDLVLEPFAAAESIRISIEGLEEMNVKDDSVEMSLPDGTVYMEDNLLVFYQDNGEMIDASFVRIDEFTYGYEIGNYDRSRTVVIDPIVYSTYFGGTLSDHSEGIAMDDQGNTYITGQTSAWDFPLTPGTFRDERIGGLDAFIAKFDSDGSDLDFCTLYGGDGDDTGFEIELDPNGNIIIAGRTTSDDIPLPATAEDDSHNGGWDVFLAKLNPTGTSLMAATYYGGSSTDASLNLVVDGNGNSYVGGWTSSDDLTITNNHINDDYGGGDISAFLCKFNPIMSNLQFSTYISTMEDDRISGLDVDGSGNIYITGFTRSDEFPLSTSPNDDTYEGSSEAFIMKINSNCNQILYSSYIGGIAGEGGYGLQIDDSGDIWITGITYSSDFPVSDDVYQNTYNDEGDIFITLLSGTDFSVKRSTFVGGSGRDGPLDMVLDPFNRITVVGDLSSTDFPFSDDAIQTIFNGGNKDGFVLSISNDLKDILYSSYVGGDDTFDTIPSVTCDPSGQIAFTGWSDNKTIPTTVNAYQKKNRGFEDAYIMGLSLDTPPTIPRNFNARSGGGFVELTWDNPEDTGSQDLSGFQIFRVMNGSLDVEIIELGLVNLYNDTDVENGKEYTYWMRAVNLAVSSLFTGTITMTPLGLPSFPLGFNVISGIRMLTLEWSAPMDDGGTPITGYMIEKRWNISDEDSIIIDPETFGHIDLDILAGIEYKYTIRSLNRIGRSEPSVERTGTAEDIPTSPRNLSVKSGNGYNYLTWERPESARGAMVTSYNLYRAMEEGQVRLLKTLGQAATLFNDTQVVNGVMYSYYITAVNGIGESLPSVTIETVPVNVPSLPLSFKAEGGDGKVGLEWERPVDDGGSIITGYEIMRQTGEDEIIKAVDEDATSFTDEDLINGVTYSYSIRAVSDVGPSSWTEQIDIIPMTVPDIPEIKLVRRSSNFVVIRWGHVNETGGSPLLGYRIFRSEDDAISMIAEVGPGSVSYNDTTVSPGIGYHYLVSALNIKGESDPSASIKVFTTSVPSAPLGLVIVQGDSALKLSWTAPISDGGTGINSYEILRIEIEGEIERTFGTGSDEMTFTDEEVVPGSQYRYRISAINIEGRGPWSDTITSLALSKPDQVSNFNAVKEGDSIQLTWDIPTTHDLEIMEIVIERSVDGGEFFEIYRSADEIGFMNDNDVRPGVEYSYRIHSNNGIGVSEPLEITGISLKDEGSSTSNGSIALFLILAVIILLIAVFILFLSFRRKGPMEPQSEEPDPLVPSVQVKENDDAVIQTGQLTDHSEPFPVPGSPVETYSQTIPQEDPQTLPGETNATIPVEEGIDPMFGNDRIAEPVFDSGTHQVELPSEEVVQ